jgi:hypothetical protein
MVNSPTLLFSLIQESGEIYLFPEHFLLSVFVPQAGPTARQKLTGLGGGRCYNIIKHLQGRLSMKQASKWSVRRMQCPEADCKTELLLEWKTEKGRKVLHSISCDHPRLLDYSGSDCQWHCLNKITAKKK